MTMTDRPKAITSSDVQIPVPQARKRLPAITSNKVEPKSAPMPEDGKRKGPKGPMITTHDEPKKFDARAVIDNMTIDLKTPAIVEESVPGLVEPIPASEPEPATVPKAKRKPAARKKKA
jgi:hypothetical protein